MKKYVFEVEVTEEHDEYWEELKTKGISGCDIILENIKDSLADHGIKVKLVRFTDD